MANCDGANECADDGGDDDGLGAVLAKLAASEVEGKMVDLGVQMHGGAGYMEEYEISRMYRDARISRIYAGTSEVMKIIIGREIFSQKYRSLLS